MNVLKGACIIGQSGGPTSVINASAYGVIDTALKSGVITIATRFANEMKNAAMPVRSKNAPKMMNSTM